MNKWIGLFVGVVVIVALAVRFLDSHVTLTNFKQDGRKIVAFGDSLTAGFGATSPSASYPGKLAALLGVEVINAGKNGDTTASALRRVQEVLDLKPNYVLITLGGNDLRQRTDLAETLANLERLFTELQNAGIAVAYLAIKPPMIGDNWTMAIQDVVRAKGVLWVDDIMKDLWGDSSMMADSVHPNDRGYEVIAERVHKYLQRYVK